jgi:RNA polymerase sigma factor (sigma-70 family)
LVPTNRVNGLTEHFCMSVLHNGVGRTDGQLLDSFIQRKDAAALAALVHRHGPMVWGVCSRMLRSHHDAEDAFQATFLILVQKAATLPDLEMVGNWLYGVARQTAVRMRALAARRGMRERQVAVMPEPASAEPTVWNDLEILDEELARLPQKYRVLIVLCQLEGKTLKDVARQLDIPQGTVASRLATARAMLGKRLSRRGVVPSVLLAAMASSASASASLRAVLVSSTIKTATLVAAGPGVQGTASPTVAALVTGVTKAMFMKKIKSVLAVALVIGLALGGGVAGVRLLAVPAAAAQQPKGGGKDDPGTPRSKKETAGQAPANPDDKRQPNPADAKKEQDKLQGTWLVVGVEEEGKAIPEQELKEAKETFVVKGGQMTYCRDGKVQITMKFVLAPGEPPNWMELEFTEGNDKGHANHAIYELDGDKLKIRMNDKFGGNSPTERPADFSTTEGKEAVLFILKRETK